MRTMLCFLAAISFPALAGDIDRTIADFRTPEQIKWVRNAAGTNEQAVLFGDILSDLGPATAGTIGIAASGNINPERTYPSIFEPVHGSAPDIAGKKIANPLAAIWSGALMLEHLGHPKAAADIVRAIERVIIDGPHTPDMKGKASTSQVGAAVAEAIRSQSKVAA